MEATWWTQPNQLDADQRKVVSLSKDGDHLVVGPPGSGKTNLLILRATFLHHAKVHDTVVLTFGRLLREFLSSGTANYPFDPGKIQTYVKWGANILKQHSIEFNEQGSFEELRARIGEELAGLIQSNNIEVKHDCILIDEAQDYSADEICIIRAFTKQVFAVGDDRQRIYQSKGGLAALENFCRKSTLNYHYRNGSQICRLADGITDKIDHPDGLEATSQYDEEKYPSSVSCFGDLSIEQQVSKAIVEIQTQLRAYPDGLVGVLCPRHSELEEVHSLLMQSEINGYIQLQRQSDGYVALNTTQRVIATTLHSAKGLEFRVLHLLGMDLIKKFPAQRRMSFTAVTRAKTSLAIYHSGSLPGYIEKGLSSLTAEVEPPSLDDLFLGDKK